jgi:hypothetical protein
MTAVGRGADITGVSRRGHTANRTDQTAATQITDLAVPGALSSRASACASVGGVRRQSNAQPDALNLTNRVAELRSSALGDDEIDTAVRGVAASTWNKGRGVLDDDWVSCQAIGRDGIQLRTRGRCLTKSRCGCEHCDGKPIAQRASDVIATLPTTRIIAAFVAA